MDKIGIYIHVPFCRSKCPYCDFYSLRQSQYDTDSYVSAVIKSIELWRGRLTKQADTLYFGGGTPCLLGAENINKIVNAAKVFGEFKEITVECNPSAVEKDFFKKIAESGVNRISLGLQSVVDAERRSLGRIAGKKDIERCICESVDSGIDNISVDMMLGIPNQNIASLDETLDFCTSCGAKHISAYMLKLEEGTYFYKNREKLCLPDDDMTADMYLHMVSRLEDAGFLQYEISNFSLDGYESRHNLKYWNCEEYLGIGPAAHSFIDGKRFYYDRDIDSFVNGAEPVSDSDGGDPQEFIMLRLRLKKGINYNEMAEKYPNYDIYSLKNKADGLAAHGFTAADDNGFHLTTKGFLLSNSVIAQLI